jgi:hypothetical protein
VRLWAVEFAMLVCCVVVAERQSVAVGGTAIDWDGCVYASVCMCVCGCVCVVCLGSKSALVKPSSVLYTEVG